MAKEHKRKIMDEKTIDLALRRMSQEIIEANRGLSNLALVGIADGGVPITYRLKRLLKKNSKSEIPVGMIDITLYRDDLTINDQPELKDTKIDFNIDGKNVVLVDDVLFTGRTVRAAITALLDYGRPGRIQLAVLIDRSHRELPIQADFVGKFIDSEKSEKIIVTVDQQKAGKKDKIVLITPINSEDV